MAYTLQQLHDELMNDPKALNYAAHLSEGDDTGVAAILNSTYAAVGTVWRQSLTAAEVLGSLVDTEVAAWTQLQWTAFQCLISTGTVDATNARIRALFAKLVSGQSLTNLTAIAKVVTPTRAEELFGAGTVIPEAQVAAAMGRVG